MGEGRRRKGGGETGRGRGQESKREGGYGNYN